MPKHRYFILDVQELIDSKLQPVRWAIETNEQPDSGLLHIVKICAAKNGTAEDLSPAVVDELRKLFAGQSKP